MILSADAVLKKVEKTDSQCILQDICVSDLRLTLGHGWQSHSRGGAGQSQGSGGGETHGE